MRNGEPEDDLENSFEKSHDAEQRHDILRRLDEVEEALGRLRPVHGGIGHNRPPEIEQKTSILKRIAGKRGSLVAWSGKKAS